MLARGVQMDLGGIACCFMGSSSHAASFLACVCPALSSFDSPLRPCLRLRGRWIDQSFDHRLLQLRPRAFVKKLEDFIPEENVSSVVSSTEIPGAEVKPISRRRSRKSETSVVGEGGQQLEPAQAVRSVANAEDSSDEGFHGDASSMGKPSSAILDSGTISEANFEQFSTKKVRKSKGTNLKSGRKHRKAAMPDETNLLQARQPELECSESPLQAVAFDMNDSIAQNLDHRDEESSLPEDLVISYPIAEKISRVGSKRTRMKTRIKTEQPKKEMEGPKIDVIEFFDVTNASEALDACTSTEVESKSEGHLTVDLHIDMEMDKETELEAEHNGEDIPSTSMEDSQFANLEHIEEAEGIVQRDLDTTLIEQVVSENLQQGQGRNSKLPKASQRERKQKTKEKKGKRVKSADGPTVVSTIELLGQRTQTARFDEHIFSTQESMQRSEDQMCPVRWLVQAQLNPNQLLFVTGTDSYLGAWDPSSAIGFTQTGDGQPNLWQAQSQIPFGTETDYNYFIQVKDGGADSIIWRPGARLHLAIPSSQDMELREMVVQDCLDFSVENKLPSLLWGSWWNEFHFPPELGRFVGTEALGGKQQEQVKISMEQDLSCNISKQEDHPKLAIAQVRNDQAEQPSGDPFLGHIDTLVSSKQIDDVSLFEKVQAEEKFLSGQISPKLKKYIRKRVFPREEPWLLESMILYEKSESSKKSNIPLAETDQKIQDSQSAMHDVADSSLSAQKPDILTEILINSSKCTMERIAILEEGKLVELLLEPINPDINVGNVYLGVVKKLLPGMTGVFVDIGHPRLALLSITKNRYPITFPPIRVSNAELNGSIVGDSMISHVVETDQDAPETDEHTSIEDDNSLEEDQDDGENEDEEADDDEEAADEDEGEDEMQDVAFMETRIDASYGGEVALVGQRGRQLLQLNGTATKPITVNFGQRFTKWRKVQEGMKIVVQVKKEPLGKKGPKVSAFPQLSSRFWVLGVRGRSIGISKKIHGTERKRLKHVAELFKRPGYDLTVRTEAAGQTQDDLEKDLMRLLDTWKDIIERAGDASIAAENGDDDAVPVLLHRAMGRTLSIVRDFFAEKVHRMVVDSSQTYQEVTSYLQEIAPHLLNRVELYTGTTPIFDAFNLESEIDKLLCERVQLPHGAYLVIEETEALVSIDVNSGSGMLGRKRSAVILETNLAAARQIAVELRLRDIGGIIVIDFIDMDESEHDAQLFEEMRKAIQMDRSVIHISEISELGLMEVTRRRVRPSVTFMISDPCPCCHGSGRVEALETTLSKIERAILRLVANSSGNTHFKGKAWPKVLLRVDPVMFEFLTKNQRATQLGSALKVNAILKVGRDMTRGSFEVTELNLGNEKRQLGEGNQRTPSHKYPQLSPVGRKGLATRI